MDLTASRISKQRARLVPSVDTSNPAMDGQVKTGHQARVRDW